MDDSSIRLHATTVAINGRAVLIEGGSGAGKSDLALRLIDRGATLVSDDQTLLRRSASRLIASAPATIAGMMEVRGIGVLPFPHAPDAGVSLLVELTDAVERMPEPRSREILGIAVPVVALDSGAASAPIKVELALERIA